MTSARRSRSAGWCIRLLSAKARLMLFLRKQLAGDDMDDVPVRAKSKSRAEPRMRRPEPEEDDVEERRRRIRLRGRGGRRGGAGARAAQIARAGAAAQSQEGRLRSSRSESSCRAESQRPHQPEHRRDRGARRGAGKRSRRFRREGRNHQCAPGSGGDAVRTRAGAGHQVVARHRSWPTTSPVR